MVKSCLSAFAITGRSMLHQRHRKESGGGFATGAKEHANGRNSCASRIESFAILGSIGPTYGGKFVGPFGGIYLITTDDIGYAAAWAGKRLRASSRKAASALET